MKTVSEKPTPFSYLLLIYFGEEKGKEKMCLYPWKIVSIKRYVLAFI